MSTARESKAVDAPESIVQALKESNGRKSFFSFGSEGVTATVGPTGRLLRISRHFPGKRTGLCVDDPELSEPWFAVYRLRELLNWVEDPETHFERGIGPAITSTSTQIIVNNRWPTFEVEQEHGPSFKLQYVIADSIVYQRFQFVNHKKSENDGQFDEYSVPGLLVSPDLLIRDLDFVDGRNEFNEDMPGLRPRFFNEDEPSLRPKYSYTSLHKGNCLVREHQIGAKKGVLSIHVLGKQDSFQFASSSSGESSLPVPQYDNPFTIQKKAAITWNPRHNTPRDECIDIILAYKLDCDSNDKAQPPLWELASNTMNSLLQADVEHSLTDGSDPTLDFFLWRNLEHILCVCSIPTTEGDGDNLPCISLTCGDVDGHRVAAAASL